MNVEIDVETDMWSKLMEKLLLNYKNAETLAEIDVEI